MKGKATLGLEKITCTRCGSDVYAAESTATTVPEYGCPRCGIVKSVIYHYLSGYYYEYREPESAAK